MTAWRPRFTVYRHKVPGKRIEWLVLDCLDEYTIATCETRRNASRVAGALNHTEHPA